VEDAARPDGAVANRSGALRAAARTPAHSAGRRVQRASAIQIITGPRIPAGRCEQILAGDHDQACSYTARGDEGASWRARKDLGRIAYLERLVASGGERREAGVVERRARLRDGGRIERLRHDGDSSALPGEPLIHGPAIETAAGLPAIARVCEHHDAVGAPLPIDPFVQDCEVAQRQCIGERLRLGSARV
jgi:hypothetical protein